MDAQNQVLAEIIIDNDSGKDREITYPQFIEVINFLHARKPYCKMQAYLMFLGFTGFRPKHCSEARVDNFLFQDRDDPRVLIHDTKQVPQRMNSTQGVVLVKYRTRRERCIPLWVRDYFEEYFRRQWMTFANSLVFPGQQGQPMTTQTWDTLLAKLRQAMVKEDSIKYSWANEVVKTEYAGIDNRTRMPKTRQIRRLSLYSFRKGRFTWYALSCLEKGLPDVPLHVAQFAGHSPRAQQHIYRYIKRLLADRIDGNQELLKPPNLNENFLGITSPSSAIDQVLSHLVSSPELRELVAQALHKERKEESNELSNFPGENVLRRPFRRRRSCPATSG